jgi:hypothetical protein
VIAAEVPWGNVRTGPVFISFVSFYLVIYTVDREAFVRLIDGILTSGSYF